MSSPPVSRVVVTASVDNRLRYAYTEREREELVRVIVDEPHDGPSLVWSWDRPCPHHSGEHPGEWPSHQLRVSTDPGSGYGAMTWVSWAKQVLTDSFAATAPDAVPLVQFDAAAQLRFPRDALVPLNIIRRALSEYLSTGCRPVSIRWQEGQHY